MGVTRIANRDEQQIVEALRDLLELAKEGQIQGLTFAAKVHGQQTPLIGFLGHHWREPSQAMAAVTRIEYKLNQLMSARYGEPDTGSTPL
jgi:hypothetical protein